MLGTEFSGGGQVAQELDHSVVEDVDHTALSGAHGPGRAETSGDSARRSRLCRKSLRLWRSTVADLGQSCWHGLCVQRQVPMVQTEQENPAEISQLQVLGKVVDMPVVMQCELPMVLTAQEPPGDSTVAGLGQGC